MCHLKDVPHANPARSNSTRVCEPLGIILQGKHGARWLLLSNNHIVSIRWVGDSGRVVADHGLNCADLSFRLYSEDSPPFESIIRAR